ncbi:flagellar biosynthetic protein FliR [Undibacterium sp. CY18W]|uniref:Flagellar biosynthetic protein FliR n=1 Tax=Undibacterium hunanense TaxID=2762292 RepID=A0ABR6ZNC9_9BURK|nr:flagellar biosynthetic protein FliR [Undibacterium hunanense]MBC3917367.1 flagellar biosynthetic protein FliR [Undibacterium hunanense]
MISFSSNELIALINSFIWPLTRILGMIAVAPPFGNNTVPVQIKLALGIVLSLIVAPTLPAMPALDPVSLNGILVLSQQLIIGIGMGFVMRVVFSAIEMAGEVAGLTMGLGFATFFDPQTQGRSSAIAQFLVLTATLLMLTANVHLSMLATLVESFQTIPISTTFQTGLNYQKMALWGEQIFSVGMHLSLPIVAALLVTNVALGILTRAAPQLNLFGIGFPITIGVGFLMLALIMPYLLLPLENLFQQGIEAMQAMGQPNIQPPKPLPLPSAIPPR